MFIVYIILLPFALNVPKCAKDKNNNQAYYDAQYFGHIVHLPLHNAQYMDVVVYHCIGIKQKMHFRFNVMLRFALKDIKKWLVGNKSVFCLVISPSIN